MISSRMQVGYFALIATGTVVLMGCRPLQPDPAPQPQAVEREASPASADASSSFNTSSFNILAPLPDRVPATQSWKIAYVLKTQTDPYWQRVKQAAISSGEALAVDIDLLGVDQPQKTEFVEEQILLIAEHLKQGELDGLILDPADSIRLAPVVEKAAAQGIPVIVMDTPLESDAILTFIGFDNFAAGQTMGQWVVQQLGGSGNVLVLEGARHHDNAIERHNGFLAGLKTGDIQVLATRSANWNLAEAEAIVRRWLTQYPTVDAIIAANDQMALGAIAAIQASDRRDILITGFDGSQSGLAALQAGQLDATIDQIPEHQARIAIELMIHYLERGESLPPTILLENKKLITRNALVD